MSKNDPNQQAADALMQAFEQAARYPTSSKELRSMRYWQEAVQTLGNTSTVYPPEDLETLQQVPPVSTVVITCPDDDHVAAAAGFAASRADVVGAGAATENADTMRAHGTVQEVEPPRLALPPGARGTSTLMLLLPGMYRDVFRPLIADAQHQWYSEAIAGRKPSRWIDVLLWVRIVGSIGWALFERMRDLLIG